MYKSQKTLQQRCPLSDRGGGHFTPMWKTLVWSHHFS